MGQREEKRGKEEDEQKMRGKKEDGIRGVERDGRNKEVTSPSS